MSKEWADKIVEWLENVIEDSNMPLDEHWETEMAEEEGIKVIRASSPKQPFNVYIAVERDFATLLIYTGIETATLDNMARLKIYRDLLLLSNKWKMVKYALEGDEDEIIIKADLDLSSLGKKEFNNALTATLIAMNDLVKKLGLEEEIIEAQIAHVMEIIKDKIEKGEKKEDIINFLMKTFNIGEDAAREIVDITMDEKRDTGIYIR